MSTVQIIRSKLQRPRVAGDFVNSSDLLALLEGGRSLPLTLLSAPAGYGKTSLVARWLDGRDGLSAWLSLDRDDSDPAVFVSYFVAAVRTAIADACVDTLACLNAGTPSSAALLASLSNDLDALSAPLVVVLDDYHRIDSPQTHALLDCLLAHPVKGLHLVVCARQDPPLSLSLIHI